MQDDALEEMPRSKLRRLLACDCPFNCAEAKVGYSVLFYESFIQRSPPRSRGPAGIPEIDETGVAAKFECQTSIVARYYVRRQDTPKDVGEAKLDPASGRMGVLDGPPSSTLGSKFGNDRPPFRWKRGAQ